VEKALKSFYSWETIGKEFCEPTGTVKEKGTGFAGGCLGEKKSKKKKKKGGGGTKREPGTREDTKRL